VKVFASPLKGKKLTSKWGKQVVLGIHPDLPTLKEEERLILAFPCNPTRTRTM
jgi:hypothetical protein